MHEKAQAGISCHFEKLLFEGTAGDDTIDGGAGPDFITGEKGNDTIRGGPDNDTIDGGAANDTIYGLAAAVWTSDIKNKWAHAWLTWPGYAQFWRQVLRDTMRVEKPKP